jgi:hypothetical protein
MKEDLANPPPPVPVVFSGPVSIQIQKSERRAKRVRRTDVDVPSFRPNLSATQDWPVTRPIRLEDVEARIFMRDTALSAMKLEVDSQRLGDCTFDPVRFCDLDCRKQLAAKAEERRKTPKPRPPSHDSEEEELRRIALVREKAKKERKRSAWKNSPFRIPFEKEVYQPLDHKGKTISYKTF